MGQMQLSDFAYALPDALIAQRPLEDRTASRLMVVEPSGLAHRVFRDVVELVAPGDVLVLNDTRVVKARMYAVKDSGGRAEILVERVEDGNTAVCQVRASKPLKPGRLLRMASGDVRVLERVGEFYRLAFARDVDEVMRAEGHVPLPPYIARGDEAADEARYQTVYGRVDGAVAAPTAGLHFTDALLRAVEKRGVSVCYVTLHVGAGTFQPVRAKDLHEHLMHAERFEIPAATAERVNACKGRVIAVGTTVVRTLESAASNGKVQPMCDETRLFITPGYEFQVVDALITNFHLPESTLLMLVTAFAGYERIMSAYREAVAAQYRFFSYGDAMFCERARADV